MRSSERVGPAIVNIYPSPADQDRSTQNSDRLVFGRANSGWADTCGKNAGEWEELDGVAHRVGVDRQAGLSGS